MFSVEPRGDSDPLPPQHRQILDYLGDHGETDITTLADALGKNTTPVVGYCDHLRRKGYIHYTDTNDQTDSWAKEDAYIARSTLITHIEVTG